MNYRLFFYNCLVHLVIPFLPLRLFWRSFKNRSYRKNILERFGRYSVNSLDGSVWVHAVSVGESLAAVPMIKRLVKLFPELPVVVTTMTPTGKESIIKALGDQVVKVYAPYDSSFIVNRFFKHFKPRILIVMETEIWPNLFFYAQQKNVPIIIANARLSSKSFAGYQKVKIFIGEILNLVNWVVAQSELDAERFIKLGLNSGKLLVGGNVKYDLEVTDQMVSEATKLRQVIGNRPVWIAASTHDGEEVKILTAVKIILQTIPDALLILVPRHPERFDEVYRICQHHGMLTKRYLELSNVSASTKIILGDVMGKLLTFYALSEIAYVGGSLVPWGGHNLLEPAALARPVLSGPFLDAFLEVKRQLIDAEALTVVTNETELANKVIEIFKNQQLRESLGIKAFEVVERHRGATDKLVRIVSELIN